ncbi:MAG TPA: SPOR domain-containing protein [bacterium]|nr:SPOR domain-containing protein [bacterium]
MPVETRKVLWTVLSVVIVLVVAMGIALALAYPRGSSAGAPASVAAVAPPRSPSPEAYVQTVEPAPVPTPAPATGSDIIIVYGDKPAASTLPGSADGSATPVPAAGLTQAIQKPYTPAASSPTKPAAVQTTKAVAKPATAQPAAKPTAPRTVSEYWIQAAAFTSRSRADDLQRDLAAKGLSTLITLKDIDGTTWYRVRIGPYLSETEAKGWLGKIKVLAGCGEAYVSKQIVQRSS